MAAHGRYGQPCPKCGTPIQRISYAENEANYCPTCQTGGRLLMLLGLFAALAGAIHTWYQTRDRHAGLPRRS